MEVKRLMPENRAIGVCIVSMAFSLSNPFGPVIGKISDSFRHPWGRRRPFIVVLVLLSVTATAGMWLCSDFYLWQGLIFLTLLQQVSWNGINATQTALLADLVDPAFEALASGFQTFCLLAGAGTGIAAFEVLSSHGQDYHLNYAIVMFLSIALLPVVLLMSPEVSSEQLSLPPKLDLHRPYATFLDIFGWDWRRFPDWTILAVERTVYYGTLVAKPFMLNFIIDCIGLQNQEEQVGLLAKVGIVGELVAAPAALLGSLAVEYGGVRLQNLGSLGALIMALGF
eukprot:5255353-Amphidinium_carterae.1